MVRNTTSIQNPSTRCGKPRCKLSDALIETDRLYFEAGSCVEEAWGGTICWMPTLATLPAGCVCHRIDVTKVDCGPGTAERWLGKVEGRFRQIGAPLSRLYLEPESALDPMLLRCGYRPKAELGYLVRVNAGQTMSQVSLESVCSADDWLTKEHLHRQTPMGSDGYPCPAHEWVQLERAKCDAGGMRCYLIKLEDAVCGAIGTMYLNGLMRIKNIVVHPAYRRQGIGSETVRAIMEMARESDAEEVGVFGIEGEAGSALYERAGFTICTSQVEWTKAISGSELQKGGQP